MSSANPFVVVALYKFVQLPDFKSLRDSIYDACLRYEIKGTLLLAHEGINGTVAGTRESIDQLLAFLKQDQRFNDLEHKESFADFTPFHRMKVRLKKEIVTLGIPQVDPTCKVGKYVDAKDWNELISDPEVIVIDTRNDYETAVGKFKGAIDPQTADFRHFPTYVQEHLADKKDRKIAMYCTGGIRCEKSTSYLLEQGFEQVYHLKGGILQYLQTVPQEHSLWEGECFVFDDRVAVNHALEKGDWELCFGCQTPINGEDRASAHYIQGIQCPHCHDILSTERRAALEQRQKQIELAKARGEAHLGDPPSRAYRPAWSRPQW